MWTEFEWLNIGSYKMAFEHIRVLQTAGISWPLQRLSASQQRSCWISVSQSASYFCSCLDAPSLTPKAADIFSDVVKHTLTGKLASTNETVICRNMWVHFWENWAMTITGDKRIASNKNHIDPSLYCTWAVLFIVCFPVKWHVSWTGVIFLIRLVYVLARKKALKSTET
jgi:hypothetical protein